MLKLGCRQPSVYAEYLTIGTLTDIRMTKTRSYQRSSRHYWRGIIGCSVAYHLARAGVSDVVCRT